MQKLMIEIATANVVRRYTWPSRQNPTDKERFKYFDGEVLDAHSLIVKASGSLKVRTDDALPDVWGALAEITRYHEAWMES